MIVRLLSSIVGLPIAFLIVWLGGFWLKLGTLFVSLIALFEFYRSTKKIEGISVVKGVAFENIFGFLISVIYVLILNTEFINYANVIFLVLFLPFLILLVFFHKKISIVDLAMTLFGFFYTTFMFSHVFLIRSSPDGIYTVWLPFLCAWLSDTGAYFAGLKFGKHKLTPTLSPKKTVEGAIGGIFLAVLVTGIYGFLVSRYINPFKNVDFTLFCVIVSFVGSVFAQLGDLTASSVKRKFNIKDYGNLIPGHGGILDRFDSIIFTSAVVYIFCKFLN